MDSRKMGVKRALAGWDLICFENVFFVTAVFFTLALSAGAECN